MFRFPSLRKDGGGHEGYRNFPYFNLLISEREGVQVKIRTISSLKLFFEGMGEGWAMGMGTSKFRFSLWFQFG